MTMHRNRIAAFGIAGAIAIGFAITAGPVIAAPVPSNTAALKQVDVSNVVDVQWRRRRNAAPWIAGAAVGIVGAAILADRYHNRYYDDGYYGYAQYPYANTYPSQRYYGGYAPYGYAPYGRYAPSSNCNDRPEAC